MRIGIMGGTFDPPHLGHLAVAEEVREEAGLAEVIFVPARISPHKIGEPALDASLRGELVAMAVRGNPYFRVSQIELEREGPSYTVDTVAELRRGFGPDAELFLIIGSDQVGELVRWKDPASLLNECTLLVATRPGHEVAGLPSWIAERMRLVKVTGFGISSSEIRERLRHGRSVRYLVPDAVLEAIESRSLYRG